MQRIALSVGFALIGLGLSTSAVAHPTDIKPVFDDASANVLFAQRALESDPVITTAAASDSVHWRPHAAAPSMNEPAMPKTTPSPIVKSLEAPVPAASGFFSSILEQVPQPGVIAMVAIGAALCRFGSAFVGIRR